MSLERVTKTPSTAGELVYRLDVRIFSLADRGTRSARGAWLCLTDERGRRFGPVQDSVAIPFDVALRPRESVATTLTFHVLPDAKQLFFSGGMHGISYASFIIGNGDLLGRPRIRFPGLASLASATLDVFCYLPETPVGGQHTLTSGKHSTNIKTNKEEERRSHAWIS